MIKKSIASILILLIFINSIGCHTYNQIKKEDTEKLDRNDKVKITTLDGKEYILTDVEIQGPILKGRVYKSTYEQITQGSRKDKDTEEANLEERIIPIEEIKKIEVDKYNPHTSALTVIGVMCFIGVVIAALSFRGGILSKSSDFKF